MLNKIFNSPPGELSLKDYRVFIATGYGSGFFKIAPGTMGSLAAIPIGYFLLSNFGIPALLLGILFCIWIGTNTVDYYIQQTGKHDPKEVVIDEFAGMWIAAIPAGDNLFLWFVAFALFRLFDIRKPWPASYYDKKVKGAWAVMLDDVIAGIYALAGVGFLALFSLNL